MRDLFAKLKPSWARRHGLGVSARKMVTNWRNRAKAGFSYRGGRMWLGELHYNHYKNTDYHQRYALPAIFAEHSERALHGVHMPLFRPLFEASDPYINYNLSHSLSHLPTGHNTEQNVRLRQRNLNYMAQQRTTLSPYLFGVLVLQKIARLPDDIIKFIIHLNPIKRPKPLDRHELSIRYDMKTLNPEYDD